MALESSPPPLSWASLTNIVGATKKRPREAKISLEVPVTGNVKEDEVKVSSMERKKRPSSIIIPKTYINLGCIEKVKDHHDDHVFEDQGSEYCLASKQGTRHAMEDGYGVITNIHGDQKQAFFGVFDGHGGRAAVDFVKEKLGKNILASIEDSEKNENQLEIAVRKGYMITDEEFLSQGVSSGACIATVLLKDGDMLVSNVGDCRVVMSKNGIANALTTDHLAGRDEERERIENTGGYVSCHNGKWRVHDSLAVSRAIGDGNMKKWIISEPETKKLHLTPDCEFLIMASDGLWDKVSNQEAIDAVFKSKDMKKSCKELVEMSWSRGSRDDITVMVVDLQKFVL
ncbi:protein phosphatase 1L protein [Dioscorea alata]|uniref:Protein phosphatase 1L protein n=1 Tax=Dioscorea alata TaxID=55571 RepID=A0ACB7WBH0_DIOAL|nr:protein phosphatase 1L protein [Dioscorea alata]